MPVSRNYGGYSAYSSPYSSYHRSSLGLSSTSVSRANTPAPASAEEASRSGNMFSPMTTPATYKYLSRSEYYSPLPSYAKPKVINTDDIDVESDKPVDRSHAIPGKITRDTSAANVPCGKPVVRMVTNRSKVNPYNRVGLGNQELTLGQRLAMKHYLADPKEKKDTTPPPIVRRSSLIHMQYAKQKQASIQEDSDEATDSDWTWETCSSSEEGPDVRYFPATPPASVKRGPMAYGKAKTCDLTSSIAKAAPAPGLAGIGSNQSSRQSLERWTRAMFTESKHKDEGHSKAKVKSKVKVKRCDAKPVEINVIEDLQRPKASPTPDSMSHHTNLLSNRISVVMTETKSSASSEMATLTVIHHESPTKSCSSVVSSGSSDSPKFARAFLCPGISTWSSDEEDADHQPTLNKGWRRGQPPRSDVVVKRASEDQGKADKSKPNRKSSAPALGYTHAKATNKILTSSLDLESYSSPAPKEEVTLAEVKVNQVQKTTVQADGETVLEGKMELEVRDVTPKTTPIVVTKTESKVMDASDESILTVAHALDLVIAKVVEIEKQKEELIQMQKSKLKVETLVLMPSPNLSDHCSKSPEPSKEALITPVTPTCVKITNKAKDVVKKKVKKAAAKGKSEAMEIAEKSHLLPAKKAKKAKKLEKAVEISKIPPIPPPSTVTPKVQKDVKNDIIPNSQLERLPSPMRKFFEMKAKVAAGEEYKPEVPADKPKYWDNLPKPCAPEENPLLLMSKMKMEAKKHQKAIKAEQEALLNDTKVDAEEPWYEDEDESFQKALKEEYQPRASDHHRNDEDKRTPEENMAIIRLYGGVQFPDDESLETTPQSLLFPPETSSNEVGATDMGMSSSGSEEDEAAAAASASAKSRSKSTSAVTSRPKFRKYGVDDFSFLKVLGKGSFGKVILAELKGSHTYYAVKCLKKDVVLEDDDIECTMIERKVLALGCKHPFLCHLFCTFQTNSHLFFVMEYLNGGDLMFHIQQSGRFEVERARFYAAEILLALKFLHKKGIVYRDLKLDNLLLDFDGHIRIADFGMCKLQIYLDKTADTFCGTPDYMAPEIIKGLRYTYCVDWWSFGVLLYEMMIGQSPFNGCDEDELFWSICNEQPYFPRFLSREAKSILQLLLEKDPSKRLGVSACAAGDICDQHFFKSIDFAKLERKEIVPPYKPKLKHALDVSYFDEAFTKEAAKLTPVDEGFLASVNQLQFKGFSYTNPNYTSK